MAWGVLAFGAATVLLHALDSDHTHSPRRFAPNGALEIVGLGDSHARAFHYPSLGVNGYSLLEDGSDLATAEYRLRMVLSEEPQVKLVLLAYSPGLLDFDFDLATGAATARRGWSVNAPFAPQAMTAREIRDRLFAEAMVFGNGSNLAVARIGALAGSAADPATVRDPCLPRPRQDQRADRHGIPGGYSPDAAPAHCLPRLGTAEAHAARIRASLAADPRLPERNAARLERMIALARAHGAQLVLVTPPYTEYYSRAAALEPVWALHTAQARALSRRTGVVFLDFRDFFPPAEYENDNRVFWDDNHLTLAGAVQFSRALRKVLVERRLLPAGR